MCAQRTHRAPKLHQKTKRSKVGPAIRRSVTSGGVKVLADMHVAPPLRRWMTRLALALVVAIAIGYVPGQLLRRDPRAVKLEAELAQVRADTRELAAGNAVLLRDVEGLRTDVHSIEERARSLGFVYPDEVIIRVRREEGSKP